MQIRRIHDNMSFIHKPFDDENFKRSFKEVEKSSFEISGNPVHDTYFSRLQNYLYSKKINMNFISSPFTEMGKKAYKNDPIAFIYEFSRPYTGEITENTVLTDVKVQNRKTGEMESIPLRKVSLSDNSSVFMLEKGQDKLSTVDVKYKSKSASNPNIRIDYAATTVGQNDYRNLLYLTVQAIIEDYINTKGEIPELEAVPSQIGYQNFNRASLYEYYGAETITVYDGGQLTLKSFLSKDCVLKMLNSIQASKKHSFIFPETEQSLEKIKNNIS